MLQKYCVYFSASRGERAEYNHWVCFVRLRMIEDWLFVMNPVPLPPLVPKNVFASPSSLCFLYVRLILNCERIAIKYAAALLYIIPSTRFPSGKRLGEWRKNETKSIQRETNTTTPEIEE